jgi:hypothetical protein
MTGYITSTFQFARVDVLHASPEMPQECHDLANLAHAASTFLAAVRLESLEV